MFKTLVIVGTGGFGREVLWAAQSDSGSPARPFFCDMFFVDDDESKHGEWVCDEVVLGRIEDVPARLSFSGGREVFFVCGIGDPTLREKMVSRIKGLPERFSNFTNIQHPSFLMSGFVEVGEGSVLCAGGIATTQVKIGEHVNVNLDCTIGHDVIVEDFVNISPGVHISGYCTLKRGCNIGTGANILPDVTIGEGAVIGAGATVVKDIPPRTVAVGTPAKVIKEL